MNCMFYYCIPLLIGLIVVLFSLFIYLLWPLSDKEINKWAKEQREMEVKDYCRFDNDSPARLKKKYESDKPLKEPMVPKFPLIFLSNTGLLVLLNG